MVRLLFFSSTEDLHIGQAIYKYKRFALNFLCCVRITRSVTFGLCHVAEWQFICELGIFKCFSPYSRWMYSFELSIFRWTFVECSISIKKISDMKNQNQICYVEGGMKIHSLEVSPAIMFDTWLVVQIQSFTTYASLKIVAFNVVQINSFRSKLKPAARCDLSELELILLYIHFCDMINDFMINEIGHSIFITGSSNDNMI